MSLEKIINGKPAIYSHSQLFSYEGYDLMPEEDLDAIEPQSILDMMDKYKCVMERLDQNK